MENSNSSNVVTQGFYAPDDAQIASLKTILEHESLQPVSLTDAKEIGIQLISLYECLVRDRQSPKEKQGHELS